MTVAFDASSSSGEGGMTPLSWQHTPIGTPRAVIVCVMVNSGTPQVTGVTYGGVTMTEVCGSPNIKTSGEAGIEHIFFLGTGIPTGTQTVSVSQTATNSKIAVAITLTALSDTEVVDSDGTMSSDSIANPSVMLSLVGRKSFAAITFHSGQDDVTGITPLTGWTSRLEHDFGARTAGVYTQDTIGSCDVNAGWTQAADDAVAVAVAVSEVQDTKVVVFEGGTQVGNAARRLDFDGSDFNVTEDSVNDQFDVAINYGTSAGTVCEGNDARLSDTRTPTDNTVSTVKVQDDAITNAKLANMATSTFKGRTAAGTGDPEDLTSAQATALLDTFTSTLKGLAPASGGGTTNFLRADGSWAAPPGGGGATGYNVPSTNTVAAINTAIGSTTRQKACLVSTDTYTFTSTAIDLTNDGQELDGQGARLQQHATTAFTDRDGMIDFGASARDQLRINHLWIDFNNNANHGRGISNYEAGRSGNPPVDVDTPFKFMIVEKIFFTGHAASGKECVYLRDLENGCVIRDIRVFSYTGSGSCIRLAEDAGGFQHGNISLEDIFISTGGSGTGNGTKCLTVEALDAMDRVSGARIRLFCNNNNPNNGQTGLYLNYNAPSGGTLNNRHWEFGPFTCEDFQTGVLVNASNSGNGGWGMNLHHFAIEPKHCSTTPGNTKGIDFSGSGEVSGTIHDGSIFVKTAGVQNAEEYAQAIDLTGVALDETDEGLVIHHVFFKNRGPLDSYNHFTPIAGLTDANIFVHDCPGYNPIGPITTPWLNSSSTLPNPQSWEEGTQPTVTGGAANPTSGTTYTVMHTTKTITVTGATQITIDGQNTGQTGGAFTLRPGQTIAITGSATTKVYGH